MSEIKKTHNIQDELDSNLFLLEPRIIISEFIPFGRNAIVAFNNKLDTFKRVKSSLITAYQNFNPDDTEICITPTKTKIDVLDFHPSEYIQFNAQVFFPEEEGIEQIEKFGISVDQSGKIILGVKVEEMSGDSDKFSIDMLIRLFTDLIFDSSKLMDTIITNHQRRILNLVFFERPLNRDKYICIIAKGFSEDITEEELFDGEANENELKQVLEYIDKIVNLDDGSKLYIGTHGLLMITNTHHEYDSILSDFCFLKAIDIFLSNYFTRIWSLSDIIRKISQETISDFSTDPRSVGKAQSRLSELSQNCVLLEETRKLVKSSLKDILRYYKYQFDQLDQKQHNLVKYLDIEPLIYSMLARVEDSKVIVEGLNHDVDGLRDQVNVINEKRLQGIFRQLRDSANIQARQAKIAEKQDSKMQILNIIFAGTLSIELVGLVTGDFSFGSQEPPDFFGIIVNSQLIWVLMNFGLWTGFAFLLIWLMQKLTSAAEDNLSLKIEYETPIHIDRLHEYLSQFQIHAGDFVQDESRLLHTISYQMDLVDSPTNVILTYDQENGFLLNVVLDVDKPRKSAKYYRKALDKIFKNHKIFRNH